MLKTSTTVNKNVHRTKNKTRAIWIQVRARYDDSASKMYQPSNRQPKNEEKIHRTF